ncbi:MAG: CDP-glycerol glycerophosphotransferase family protein [Bacteroidetes bacterium]|nr:CDP-glycerol glycerophosphotransferase family protein [Bacteroidota bacterium]
MRILIIVQPDRIDHYQYLAQDTTSEYCLLWYEKRELVQVNFEQLPIKFSTVAFWKDYATPKALIKKLQPDKIVFFEIIDLRQIALISAAHAMGISTFYLEHGAAGDRNTTIARWQEITFVGSKLPYLFNRLRKALPDVIASKYFYYSQQSGFKSLSSRLKYNFLPFKLALKGPNEGLSESIFPERIPKYAICFNQANLEAFQTYTGISKDKALLIGIPFFDHYFRSEHKIGNYVVFIEHPYLEQKNFNWNDDFHSKVAHTIYAFATKRKLKVYVKLHPRSNMANWSRYNFDPQFVEIIQEGDYTQLYLESRLIIGYSSSLMTGFLCAKKNIVLLGWNPEPRIFGSDFSATGLCRKSLDMSDLENKYDYWVANNLCNESENYQAFLKRYNYPFDGKATQRVIDAIHSL